MEATEGLSAPKGDSRTTIGRQKVDNMETVGRRTRETGSLKWGIKRPRTGNEKQSNKRRG